MKVLKKISSALAIACAAIAMLSGCSVSFPSGNTALPADGIVKQAVFQDAKKNSRMLTFHGTSQGFTYSWFFDGASIAAPFDQNLKVDFADAGSDLEGAVFSSESVKFSFHEKHLIEAETTLQIDFPRLLSAREVRVYRKESGKTVRLLEAPLNNDKISSVTFPVSGTDGDFYLAAVDSSFSENSAKITAPAGPVSTPAGGNTEIAGPSSGGDTASAAATGGPGQTRSGAASQNPAVGAGPSQKNGFSPSSAGSGEKDRYRTDPTPAGKPKPAEPQDVEKNIRQAYYCTLSIDCKTILNNTGQLNKEKEPVVPPDGVIFKSQKVLFYKGESVFDVLLRETKKNNIQMEYEATPIYNSNYIEGIHNLYEFDCGPLSGWTYQVNGWYPNYGCSRYLLKSGDVVEWRYTCDLGRDVGCDRNLSQK